MNASARPSFERGVRYGAQPDGSAMLLVPEGAVRLNATAAATLALVNGERTVDDIIASVRERFDVDDERARAEIVALLTKLVSRRMIVLA